MNELLDITELVKENKRQESNRLSVFEEILKKCHSLIRKYNRERIREMHYTIPRMILGKPKYDLGVLRNYLVHHLRDNGLRVDTISDNVLYISWKETDVDLSKYLNRKTIIDNRNSSLYNVEGMGPGVGVGPSLRLDRGQTDTLKEQIDMLRFRQEKQLEIKRAREGRYQLQAARLPVTSSYEDYMRRY